MDQKRDAAPAESADIHISRPCHKMGEAQPPFENRRRAGEAAARQHGGEYRVAPGFAIGNPLPVGQRLGPGLTQGNMIVEREIDGLL